MFRAKAEINPQYNNDFLAYYASASLLFSKYDNIAIKFHLKIKHLNILYNNTVSWEVQKKGTWSLISFITAQNYSSPNF